jgi:4-hydroxybenzoyl-CoA thioesterase
VESSITEWRRSSFDVQHKLFRREVLAVECSETRVWAVRSMADPDAIEGQAVPQDVIARFGAPQTS